MTEAEFERFILPCHRKMYAAAYVILSDGDEAADVVQECFARLWERRSRIENPQSPEAYCLTVVRRLSIDRIRRTRNVQSIDDTPVETAGDDSADRKLEQTDTLRMVDSLIGKLPEQQQKVIRMSSALGMDNKQIAEATGLSDVNVRTLLSRGRRQLKRLFEKNN